MREMDSEFMVGMSGGKDMSYDPTIWKFLLRSAESAMGSLKLTCQRSPATEKPQTTRSAARFQFESTLTAKFLVQRRNEESELHVSFFTLQNHIHLHSSFRFVDCERNELKENLTKYQKLQNDSENSGKNCFECD